MKSLEKQQGHGFDEPTVDQKAVASRGYEAMPFLKPPTWDWHIWWYFFLEGASAGSFVLATVAELAGQRKHAAISRLGRATALAALLPCPPLLIADLGRPERFHHMLRIFKRTSAMSIGAWGLLAYSMPVTLLAVLGRSRTARVGLSLLGLPPAMLMLGYPGALLATTANPLWSRGKWLPALFAASSMHSGAAALRLLLGDGDRVSAKALELYDQTTAAAQGLILAAWLRSLGPQAKPLTKSPLFWAGAVGAGIVLPALLSAGKPTRFKRLASAGLALAGSLVLKWAITRAGRVAAADPSLNRMG